MAPNPGVRPDLAFLPSCCCCLVSSYSASTSWTARSLTTFLWMTSRRPSSSSLSGGGGLERDILAGSVTTGHRTSAGPDLLALAGLTRVETPELMSFSVEKPESTTVLPVLLPSGDFRSFLCLGILPVLGWTVFQD